MIGALARHLILKIGRVQIIDLIMRRLLELNLSNEQHHTVELSVIGEFRRWKFELDDVVELALLTLATAEDVDAEVEIQVVN